MSDQLILNRVAVQQALEHATSASESASAAAASATEASDTFDNVSEAVTTGVTTLNSTRDAGIATLNSTRDAGIATLNSTRDAGIATLNSTRDTGVTTLNSTRDAGIANLQTAATTGLFRGIIADAAALIALSGQADGQIAVVLNAAPSGSHLAASGNYAAGISGWTADVVRVSGVWRVRRQYLPDTLDTLRLSVSATAGTAVTIRITTENALQYRVSWGDGTTTTHNSGVTASKTYAYAYAGRIEISIVGGSIQQITRLEDSAGGWNYDLSALTALKALTNLNVSGTNTLTGTLASLPAGVVDVGLAGSNTISGGIMQIPTLKACYFAGSNTISGTITAVNSGATSILIAGVNQVSGYVTGAIPALATGMTVFRCSGTGVTMTGAMIDQILIDIAATLTVSRAITVNLSSKTTGRSSASDAAYAAITAAGGTITLTINP